VGSALGVYAAIGWLSVAISPVVFGRVVDETNGAWGTACSALGVVALLGPGALLILRRHPASERMARGKS
jgi:MFS family permease